jgi:hypothetical protein
MGYERHRQHLNIVAHNGPIKGFIGDNNPIRQRVVGMPHIIGLIQHRNVIIKLNIGHNKGDKIDKITAIIIIIGLKIIATAYPIRP